MCSNRQIEADVEVHEHRYLEIYAQADTELDVLLL